MAPEALLDETMLAEGVLPNSEITQRIKEAMEPSWDGAGAPLDFVYSVVVHPLMRSELGHVVFISFPSSSLPSIDFLTS